MSNITKKDAFIKSSQENIFSKVILGLRMPDGTKEIIINDNVAGKVDYVKAKYDDNLTLNGAVTIEEYLFITK